MITKQQSGFGVVPIIVIVTAVAVLGFVGYKVYNVQSSKPGTTNSATTNNQTKSVSSQPNSTQASATPATQTDPNAGYVVIKEWGVRFKPVEGLTGVEYALTDSNTVQLTTSQLKDLDSNCNAQTYPALGGIVKSSDASVASSQSLGKVGNYYYYYYTPHGVCSDQASVRDIQTKTLTNLKASLPSFEAAK